MEAQYSVVQSALNNDGKTSTEKKIKNKRVKFWEMQFISVSIKTTYTAKIDKGGRKQYC